MRLSPRGREFAAIVAALALHVALLVVPRRDRPTDAGESTEPIDALDIEIESPPPPIPEAPLAEAALDEKAAPSEKEPPAAPGAVAAKVTPLKESVVAPVTPPPAEAPPPPLPPPESPGSTVKAPPVDEYGGPPEAAPGPGGAGVVGLPPGVGAPIWSLPGAMPSAAPPKPAPTVATGPRPVDRDVATKVLEGSLHSRDKEVGIEVPAAGVVATTLASVVRSSAAPLDARATFEVKLDGQGKVTGVRLVSASAGEGPTWDGIVRAAKGALGGRALQMGPDGKGVTVTVKVESKVQYPAGSKKKVEMQFVCANEVLDKIGAAFEGAGNFDLQRGPVNSGTMVPAPPGMSEEDKQRFCIPIGIRGTGDLSNIGAHRVNVVSSTFSVKREGERALPAGASLPIDTRVPWAPEDPTKTRKPPPPKKKKKKKKGEKP